MKLFKLKQNSYFRIILILFLAEIDLAKSIMIGDAVSDIEAGVNSNMDTMLLLSGRGEDAQKNLGEFSPTYIAKDLAEGAGKILGMSS